jgi:hypothetical protein
MPSRAVLTEAQTIPNADIVQALANLKITATSGITTTLPTTSSTLAILAGQTFTGTQAFSGTITIVATTSTTGQILQAGTRLIHTYGTQNLFMGSGAGNFSTTGNGQNVGIGRLSLSSLTSGIQNACIGDSTGNSITTGSTNMLMGYNAGSLLSTGSANCAIGVSCMNQATSTSNNVAVGYQSLGLTTGSSSTGIGHNAGYYATGGNGTYIGQGAGIATSTIGGLAGVAITSAVNCTMLGQGSGSTSATGDYRTAIGSDSRCNAANALKLGRDTLDRVIFPSWTADPASDLVVGMVIFRSDTSTLKVYTSAGWKTITAV